MRFLLHSSAGLFLFALLPYSLQAQEPSPEDRAKIREATAAAPNAIGAEAEVRDWDGRVLRPGTNGWTCYPSIPDSGGDDAMCLDDPWVGFVEAWVERGTPNVTTVGFGYMLCGDAPSSNLDPFAEGPTADNEWMSEGMPHLMIVVPDAEVLRGLPTEPHLGGPWVMWRDTPFVHVMVPLPRNPDC